MTNLEWYRTFKAIYESESLNAAAKKLYLTQPGVSKHLAALEVHVGKKLFKRTPRKILPTEYGKFLYTQVSAAIEELENAENNFKKAAHKKYRSLVIGCQYDYYKKFVAPQLGNIDMHLAFKFGEPLDLIESLEKEGIHLLLGTPKYNHLNHEFTYLSSAYLTIVASPELVVPDELTPLPIYSKKAQKWLSGQRWYAYDIKQPFIKKYWEHHFNAKPTIVAERVIPCFEDIINDMQKNGGLCVMPSCFIEEYLAMGKIKEVFPDEKHFLIKKYAANKCDSDFLYEINYFKENFSMLRPSLMI